jgi:hypothetical protein
MVLYEYEAPKPVDYLNTAKAYDFEALATNTGYTDATKRDEGFLCSTASKKWGIAKFTVEGAYTLAAGAFALIAATVF